MKLTFHHVLLLLQSELTFSMKIKNASYHFCFHYWLFLRTARGLEIRNIHKTFTVLQASSTTMCMIIKYSLVVLLLGNIMWCQWVFKKENISWSWTDKKRSKMTRQKAISYFHMKLFFKNINRLCHFTIVVGIKLSIRLE